MRNLLKKFHQAFTFRTKALLAIIFLIALIFVTVSVVIISSNRQDLLNQMKDNSAETAQSLGDACLEPLIMYDLSGLMALIHSAIKNGTIESIEIYDKDFRVLAASDINRLGRKDTSIVSIFGDSGRLRRNEKGNVKWTNDWSIVSKLVINDELLGAMKIEFDQESITNSINEKLSKVGQKLFFLALLVFAIGIAGSLLVSFMVTTPVQRLRNKMANLQNELCQVDETQCIPEEPKGDELEQLDAGFDLMATNLKRYLEELERLNEEKEVMNCMAMIGEMSMKVAHEVRNALYSIRGATSYLDKAVRNKLVKEYTKIINESVENLNNLTTSLLDFARPMEPQLDRCELRALISKSVNLLKPDLEEKGITLSTGIEDKIYVFADKNQINQVLLNLILNAVDAVSTGGNISVSANQVNGFAEIQVIDDGIGIPLQQQNEIFKPFVTTKSKGSGLGLSTVQRIIRRHHGTIGVRSIPSKGSCFMFTLPISDSEG